ncbi:hypothetical protein [Thermococcus sp.]|uniref:hypothetical protein n=1 Tax=Thermococcus sp. TaxID=35749 RepID=UPI0025CE008D|nr:hypothetical protein [Thermococcus sp.]
MTVISSNIRKELFRSINNATGEIREGLRYGIPHLAGEISIEGKEPRVEVVVTVFENTRHSLLITDGGTVRFLFPSEDDNPHRLFMKLWMFLNGKSEGNYIRPGRIIKEPLYEALRKRRFEVIWTSSRGAAGNEYTEVIAVRDGVRYNMLFEMLEDNTFRVIDVKEASRTALKQARSSRSPNGKERHQ